MIHTLAIVYLVLVGIAFLFGVDRALRKPTPRRGGLEIFADTLSFLVAVALAILIVA